MATNGMVPRWMSAVLTSGGATPFRKNGAESNGGVRK
jgi:hypothetical protein